jgi:hypothetical protein
MRENTSVPCAAKGDRQGLVGRKNLPLSFIRVISGERILFSQLLIPFPGWLPEKSSSFPCFHSIRASVFIRAILYADFGHGIFFAPETRTLLTGSEQHCG